MEKSCRAETSIGIRRLLDDLILDAAQSALSTSIPDEQEDVKVKKSPEKIFQCEECEYSTLRRNAFYGHTRAVHVRRKVLKSMESNRDMVRKETIKRTIIKNSEQGGYDCGICGNNFAKKARIHDEERKQYPCEICGHTFNQQTNLDRHVRVVHEGIYDHECKSCDKKFSTNYLMQVHAAVCNRRRQERQSQNLLTKPKVIQVKTVLDPPMMEDLTLQKHGKNSQGSSETTAGPDLQQFLQAVANILKAKGKIGSIQELQKVLNLDDAGRKVEMDEVKADEIAEIKYVGTRRNNKTHKARVIDTKKEFKCKICGVKFLKSFILQRHIREVHENKADYKCEICSKTLFSKQKLRLHMRICHGSKIGTPENKLKGQQQQRVEVVNLISPGRPGSWPAGIKIEANT